MNPLSSAAIIDNSYQTQVVRDLVWACFSPPILQIEQICAASGVAACTLQLTPTRRLWLEQLDRNPALLLEHLSLRPTHRLGLYFEQLWHFFLQQDPATELIAHNLPVHNEGRTLGEFDCIYYSKQRRCHVHLELAVKYFLGLPRAGDNTTPATAHEWLGPDHRDRLQTKLDQLLQRQILLGDAPAAKRILQDIGIGEMAREIALKGYFFRPKIDAPPPPPGYNRACTLAYWVTCGQLASHCAALDATAFAILPKMNWLSAAQCNTPAAWLSLSALQAQAALRWQRDHYPLLIAAQDDSGTEVSRFFLTPDSWPDSCQR